MQTRLYSRNTENCHQAATWSSSLFLCYSIIGVRCSCDVIVQFRAPDPSLEFHSVPISPGHPRSMLFSTRQIRLHHWRMLNMPSCLQTLRVYNMQILRRTMIMFLKPIRTKYIWHRWRDSNYYSMGTVAWGEGEGASGWELSEMNSPLLFRVPIQRNDIIASKREAAEI